MAIQTIRKCKECKKNIVLEKVLEGKERAVFYQNSYHHFSCIVLELSNKTRGKFKVMTDQQVLDFCETLEKDHLPELNNVVNKNHLYTWLQIQYGIVAMPSYIFHKMESIFTGEYKGMSRPVPPEDLLDIFERQWDNLCKLASWKHLEGTDRLNYDLAVVLAKTSSYYRWKEQKAVDTVEGADISKEQRTNYDNLTDNKNNKDDGLILDMEDE
jgi:hypothetical protein